MLLPHGGQLRELSKTINYLAQNLASNKHMVNGNHVYCYLAVGSSQPFTSVGLGFLTVNQPGGEEIGQRDAGISLPDLAFYGSVSMLLVKGKGNMV